MSEQKPPLVRCPFCNGKGEIEDQREGLITRLLAVCKDLNDDELQEVILYANYLRSKR